MATLTELALFKQCVESPQYIQSLSDLNLDRIGDPSNMVDITESVYYQKKAMKLFHMTWSGVTKYMRTVCQIKNKPVQFPGLGVFVPINISEETQSQQATRLTSKALNEFNPADYDVTLMVNEDFLKKCGGSVKISEQPQDLISSYDSVSGEIKFPGMQHINLGSIAKVCDTDILSVEMVIKEIIAQIQYQLKKGANIRLMFKIGKLISRGGELSWRSFREDGTKSMNRTFHGDPTLGSQAGSNYSKIMVGSQYKKDMSVLTPSIAKTRAFSNVTSEQKSFHMANPNPQQHNARFKGVRDVGYADYQKLIDPTDVIKFGKKVNYETKTTNDQVMDEHLRQMRDKMEYTKLNHDLKRKQEKEFLAHIKQLEELEKQRYSFGKKAINQDFVYYNGKMQAENSDKKNQLEEQKKKDKYNYFPFVSGDLIEKHRANLGAQLKNDLQSFMDYQKKNSNSISATHRIGSKKAAEADANFDVASMKSFYQTGGMSNNRSRAVKQLFDSEYVKPEENFRVLQDNNPLKSAALKEALTRYEQSLKKDNVVLGTQLKDHNQRISFDNDELNREKEVKINKQKQFRQQIQEQMELNAELRDQQKMISKLPISTGFTPESQSGEATVLFAKKLKQQEQVKNLLLMQMNRKTENEQGSKNEKIQHEIQLIEENKRGLEIQREQKKVDKERAKKHWADELGRVRGLKKVEGVPTFD